MTTEKIVRVALSHNAQHKIVDSRHGQRTQEVDKVGWDVAAGADATATRATPRL